MTIKAFTIIQNTVFDDSVVVIVKSPAVERSCSAALSAVGKAKTLSGCRVFEVRQTENSRFKLFNAAVRVDQLVSFVNVPADCCSAALRLVSG